MTTQTRRSARDHQLVRAALRRLVAHATEVETGWVPEQWQDAASGRALTMRPLETIFGGVGVFEDLPVEPGRSVAVTTRLDLPDTLYHVALTGDRLLLTIDGLYPVDVTVNGERVFGDTIPVVASGPALIEALGRIDAGDNGELRLDIHFSDVSSSERTTGGNVPVHLTTPGLRHRFELVDVTYARLLLADGLCATDEEAGAVVEAARLIPEDVAGLDGDALAALAETVTKTLTPVAGRVEAYRVHCIAHAHTDLAWRWTWSDSREVIKRDVRTMLALMEEFDDFCYTHSQPAAYALLEAEEPEMFAAVVERIAEGRWEPATLQWVEGDTNIASGPAQARQLLEGVRYSREHLDARPVALLAPDTFGHAGNMPQLATSGGAGVYYHHRGNPGIEAGGDLWPAYWWEGDDGSRILAISTPVYLSTLSAGRIARDVLALGAGAGVQEVCYFYGVGDHGGGPARQAFQRLAQLRAQPGLPRLQPSTLTRFRDALLATQPVLPVHRGESMTVFEGCYTSHADTKAWNREGENLLGTAETLSALAGLDRRQELSQAWRRVLFNQFHDILDGSAVHEVYADQAKDFAEVAEVAARVTDDALDRLGSGMGAGTWVVTNPLAVDRRDVVHIEQAPPGEWEAVGPDGTRYPTQASNDGGVVFVADVGALASVGFRLEPVTQAAVPLQAGEVKGSNYPGARYVAVDTDVFYAQVRADCGVVTTLFDKRVGRELVGYGTARARGVEQVRPDLALGVLQVAKEYPHVMSSWVIDDIYEERSLIRGARTEVVESGPVRLVLETNHRVDRSQVTCRLTFYAELPRVDVEVVSDWREVGDERSGVPNLLMSFGSRLDAVQAWYETPFGAACRPADGMVVPALRWADVGNDEYGIAILNDGKYGHDALGSRLRVNLVRSSYDPDPDPESGRIDRSRLVIWPHPGSWRTGGVVDAAAGLNQPFLVRAAPSARADLGEAAPAGFRPRLIGQGGVVLAGLKQAHDGSGRVVQLYESTGRASSARLVGLPPGATVWEVSVVEDRGRRFTVGSGGDLELALRPFEVRFLLVEEQTGASRS